MISLLFVVLLILVVTWSYFVITGQDSKNSEEKKDCCDNNFCDCSNKPSDVASELKSSLEQEEIRVLDSEPNNSHCDDELDHEKQSVLEFAKNDKTKCYVFAEKDKEGYKAVGYYPSLNSFYQKNKDSVKIKKSNFYRIWKIKNNKGEIFKFNDERIFCTLLDFENLKKKI